MHFMNRTRKPSTPDDLIASIWGPCGEDAAKLAAEASELADTLSANPLSGFAGQPRGKVVTAASRLLYGRYLADTRRIGSEDGL